MNFKAVLFDLDGTLIDTETFHLESWNELLTGFGIRIEQDDYFRNYSGVSVAGNCKRLIEKYKLDVKLEEFAHRREAIHTQRLLSRDVPLMPYAKEALVFFRSLGIPAGLVTSGSRPEVEIVLDKTGFAEFFTAVITRNDVANLKPHPDPYLAGARAMGYPPDACLVLEDTLSGITSAKRAGLTCFAVQSADAGSEALRDVADQYFHTLGEVCQFVKESQLTLPQ